ncbi:MAG: hypothetical protein EAZ42_00125 [Verrucomicrobia bacterium]|nr:MAG: hypothetical protein EAZ42_00125 [Verrucomicrobiota bacterium]
MTDRGSHLIFEWLKANLLIPPIIAICLAAAWLGSQQRSISTLELQTAVLQKAIANRSSSSLANSSADKPTSAANTDNDSEALDWKKIAELLMQEQRMGGFRNIRSMINLERRSMEMSKEQLLAALDEIAKLDLPKSSRDILEQMLIPLLIQKDPELALKKYIDRIHGSNGFTRFALAKAMEKWTKKDSASAIAWFDEQIATGKFDSKSLNGKSSARFKFEGHLIGSLLDSDLAAAKHRLNSLPEDQRKDALAQISYMHLEEERQIEFAELVRKGITEKDQAEILGRHGPSLVSDENGYEKVSAYLQRIQATPSERTACVEKVVESQASNFSMQEKITREDLNTMREWVTSLDPESTAAMTGKALAKAISYSGKVDFSEAAELALEYNAASGNDDVLSAFLQSNPVSEHREEARLLAEKISDPKLREEILNNLE